MALFVNIIMDVLSTVFIAEFLLHEVLRVNIAGV